MGLSRWKTPLSLWAEKTGQLSNELSNFEAAEIGTELEDYVNVNFPVCLNNLSYFLFFIIPFFGFQYSLLTLSFTLIYCIKEKKIKKFYP